MCKISKNIDAVTMKICNCVRATDNFQPLASKRGYIVTSLEVCEGGAHDILYV